jgi:hypothetical protein
MLAASRLAPWLHLNFARVEAQWLFYSGLRRCNEEAMQVTDSGKIASFPKWCFQAAFFWGVSSVPKGKQMLIPL